MTLAFNQLKTNKRFDWIKKRKVLSLFSILDKTAINCRALYEDNYLFAVSQMRLTVVSGFSQLWSIQIGFNKYSGRRDIESWKTTRNCYA